MRSLLSFAALAALFGASPGSAQDVLDRTDPTLIEDRARLPKAPPATPPTAIEAQRALPPQVQQDIEVGAVSIVGARAIPVGKFADIVQRYSARSLDPAALARLANEITERARARGFVFATASVQPQSLSAGVLVVTLDEGRIDRLRVIGGPDHAVRAQLRTLLTGAPVTLAQLERALTLAGDIPGVAVRRTRYARDRGEGILTVEIARSYATGHLIAENDGTRPIGPERARLDGSFNAVLSPTDQLSLTVATTPFQPSELQYGRAAYRVIATGSGTTLGLSGSLSGTRPGAFLLDRDLTGRAWRAGLEVRHPLIRTRKFGLWAEGDADLRDLRQSRSGTVVRHDRIPVLRAGLATVAALGKNRLRGRVTYSRGLSMLGATERGNPLASRRDASAVFDTLGVWIDWDRDLPGAFSLKLTARGQLASRPVLSAEDVGLGGDRSVRAYDYNERTGDQGVMSAAELRYDWRTPPKLVQSMQIYAYADGGVVDDLRAGRRGGSLASAGGGIRAELTRRFGIDLELGVPLTGIRADSGDASPNFAFRTRYAF